MSDPIDRASEQEEMARASALVTSRKPEGPAATGECLYCGEPLTEGRRWCNAEHRDLWEKNSRRLP